VKPAFNNSHLDFPTVPLQPKPSHLLPPRFPTVVRASGSAVSAASKLGSKIIKVLFAKVRNAMLQVPRRERGCASPQCPNLILLHQARVAHHVGSEDGRQPPLDFVLLRTHRPLGAWCRAVFCCGWSWQSSLPDRRGSEHTPK
jgi:hypothetical protein